LIKELWAFTGNRIAVRFAYEWHDDAGNWFRSYPFHISNNRHKITYGTCLYLAKSMTYMIQLAINSLMKTDANIDASWDRTHYGPNWVIAWAKHTLALHN
jgi:hypothetical protein